MGLDCFGSWACYGACYHFTVPTRITQILTGTRSITGDTALSLAHFFRTSAQFWLNLQSPSDLRLGKEEAGNSINALPRLKRGSRFMPDATIRLV